MFITLKMLIVKMKQYTLNINRKINHSHIFTK